MSNDSDAITGRDVPSEQEIKMLIGMLTATGVNPSTAERLARESGRLTTVANRLAGSMYKRKALSRAREMPPPSTHAIANSASCDLIELLESRNPGELASKLAHRGIDIPDEVVELNQLPVVIRIAAELLAEESGRRFGI